MDTIIILDFGSQYSHLIARRIRELQVYSELIPYDSPCERILHEGVKGFILSGGPASVYEPNSPIIPKCVLESSLPILGICYGMQAITHAFRGRVEPSFEREYGTARVEIHIKNDLIPACSHLVWMSHGDRIEQLPEGFIALGSSENSPIVAIEHPDRKYFGIQFHPEVHHTPRGLDYLSNFTFKICEAEADWRPESIISSSVKRIQSQVGDEVVISAVSGGVDSSVATALVQKAIGNQLVSIFVDTGLLRSGEVDQVHTALHNNLGVELIVIDAVEKFLQALKGVTDPEEKRRIIGELFIRIFEQQAEMIGKAKFLVQGTIYPDVVESSAPERSKTQRIKSHHNVGGLPDNMNFDLVEPLR